ncbi:MAG TPA: PIG-L family deacetylase, partial [Thermodesulfovibrionales bacterium]|nr:PIG-L family deacetylase [Thermodesulfovibrionales bacterium]
MDSHFPECNNLLILAPHPDDEALGCSGTIMLLNRKGASSTVVFLTDGERLNGEPSATVGEKRREEGRRASKMLGCEEPVFLGFPDGEVGSHADGISRELSGLIAEKEPDIILAPSPLDFHQDHIAASKIALGLLEGRSGFKLAFYEVYSTVRFTHLIDIVSVVAEKEKAILNYHTSLYNKPELYVHAIFGLNAQRSIFTQSRGYYEAFWLIEKPLRKEE